MPIITRAPPGETQHLVDLSRWVMVPSCLREQGGATGLPPSSLEHHQVKLSTWWTCQGGCERVRCSQRYGMQVVRCRACILCTSASASAHLTHFLPAPRAATPFQCYVRTSCPHQFSRNPASARPGGPFASISASVNCCNTYALFTLPPAHTRFHEIEPQPGLEALPPHKLSAKIVSASALKCTPSPVLGDNTLVLSDDAVVGSRDGHLFLMLRCEGVKGGGGCLSGPER